MKRAVTQSLEAEQAVIGAVLIRGAEVLDDVADLLGPDDFFHEKHRTIWKAALGLPAVDLLTVTDRLTSTGELKAVGGAAYVSDLTDKVVTAANVRYYAKIVRDKARVRRLMAAAAEIAERAQENPQDVGELLDEAEQLILSARGEVKSNDGMIRVGDRVTEYFNRLETRVNRRGLSGTATGLVDLDRLLGGLHGSEFIVVAARPGHGKSALVLTIAESLARQGLGTGIFSLEMGFSELEDRLYASVAGVHLTRLRGGWLNDGEIARIAHAGGEIADWPISVSDRPGQGLAEIRAEARRAKRILPNLGLIAVDYLQLVKVTESRGKNREREVAEISSGLKELAKELRLPVVGVVALNRDVMKRKPPIPRLSDLRESGSIEYDADVVLMLYNADVGQRDRSKWRGEVLVLVEKQRNGPTGSVKLRWFGSEQRFENLAADEEGADAESPPEEDRRYR